MAKCLVFHRPRPLTQISLANFRYLKLVKEKKESITKNIAF